MKQKLSIAFVVTMVMALVFTSITGAQYPGYNAGTAYQIVNIGDTNISINIDYYDATGVKQTAASRLYTDVEVNGSRLVLVPRDETSLGSGSFSAVVSASGPVAGIVNQEYYPIGNTTNPTTPFSSYSAVSEASTAIYLPVAMYNYYGYYTEFFIQNAGTANVADVKIEYIPGTVNGVVVGTPLIDNPNSINLYATLKKSQATLSALGAPAGSGSFTGRFFGSAKITSSQPLVVVVNQHNIAQTKLMTYNGFNNGSTSAFSPTALRGWYNYYTALTVLNTNTTEKACARLTYYPDLVQSAVLKRVDGTTNFTPVVAEFVVNPKNALLRYEGDEASSSQSDLKAVYTRFTGSILIESFTGSVGGVSCTQQPLASVMNVESKAGLSYSNQAGSFNAIPISNATNKMVSPVILANFYGYYTVMLIANTTATQGTCNITYTTGPGSTVGTGVSKTYTRTLNANGSIFIYEGNPTAPDSRSDINADAFWKGGGSVGKFIGSASVECKDSLNNPIKVVAFVNEEVNKNGSDSMYTFNTINK